MYTRYYDNYEERARKVPDEPTKKNPSEDTVAATIPTECEVAVAGSPLNILSGLKTDDIILIGLLILVLSDGCDDYLLPVILGFLLISNH